MQTKEIIDLKSENNFAFGKLYQDNFLKISNFVLNNNGNHSDAEDLFQDSMLVLVEKLRKDDFRLTASINTYVYAICKILWLKKLRNKNIEFASHEIESENFQQSIDYSIENEKSYWDKLSTYLSNVSDHCKTLLDMFCFERKTIEEIQKHFGYSTKHNALNQKYKCVEQVRAEKEKDKE